MGKDIDEPKKKAFTVRIGPLMRQCLDKQKSSIKSMAYNVLETSDFMAGEVLARKILDNQLV